ncbi:hypothetical protein KIN20_003204 [Parelaphostrongylus tenuis]|uniref:Uncharacterized protein n=1 Tax=Parelaphostrongylus tenuis TaxID=148309 RepID=A0AAD5QE48_PARTN|nr:hypothetical protein KIN20_003204 [Parelaphostrongylus tenuis]
MGELVQHIRMRSYYEDFRTSVPIGESHRRQIRRDVGIVFATNTLGEKLHYAPFTITGMERMVTKTSSTHDFLS